jgi:hypothetical protein
MTYGIFTTSGNLVTWAGPDEQAAMRVALDAIGQQRAAIA